MKPAPDLIKLDSDGLILRVRGGGVLPPAVHHIERFGNRDQDSAEKRRIALAIQAIATEWSFPKGSRLRFPDSATPTWSEPPSTRPSPLLARSGVPDSDAILLAQAFGSALASDFEQQLAEYKIASYALDPSVSPSSVAAIAALAELYAEMAALVAHEAFEELAGVDLELVPGLLPEPPEIESSASSPRPDPPPDRLGFLPQPTSPARFQLL